MGKEVLKEDAWKATLWDLSDFYKALGASQVIGAAAGSRMGLAMYSPAAHRLRGVWYVKVPVGKPVGSTDDSETTASWQPPAEMEEIRGSDYLRAQEEAAA